MNKSKLIRLLIPLLFIAVGAVFLFYPDNDGKRDDSEQYFVNQGHVFGTYYNIRYQASRDLQDEIIAELQRFDNSLSAFNSSGSSYSFANRAAGGRLCDPEQPHPVRLTTTRLT